MFKNNKILNSNLSQGHVEMIISLVLFVSALVFIFVFISPFPQNQEKIPYLKNVERQIIGDLDYEIGKLSVVTNVPGGCYYFKENNYREDSKTKYIEVLDSTNPRKYNIYFSDMFEDDFAPHLSNNPAKCRAGENYTLSSYSKESIIFYERIEELKNSYELDYRSLKNSLGINREFSFSVLHFDKKEIPGLSVSKLTPTGVERESGFIPIRVMNKNAEIQELILNLKVW